MSVFGAALGRKEIVPFAYMIQVRSFYKTTASSFADTFGGSKQLSRVYVNFAQRYAAFSKAILAIAHKKGFVAVKQQGRIDSAPFHFYRFRPLAVYIIGIQIKISFSVCVCDNHIKSSLIIAYGGGKNASRRVGIV